MKSSHPLSALFASHSASSTAFLVRIHDIRTNIKCQRTHIIEMRTGYLESQFQHASAVNVKCFISSPDGLNPRWQVSGGCQGFSGSWRRQMGSPVSEFDTGSVNEVPPVALSDISLVPLC